MTTLALLLVALAVAAPFINRAIWDDFFSPTVIVVSAWCGTLGLFALGLLPYRPPRAATTVLLAATVLVLATSTAVGTWLGRRSRPSREWPAPDRPEAWVTGFALLGLTGVVWYVTGVVRLLGWGGFGDGPVLRNALSNYDIPSTFLFLEYFCLVSPLLLVALVLAGTPVRARAWFLPGCCVLGTLLSTDRTQFFTILLSSFFMVVFRFGPSWPRRRVLLAAVLCPAVLLVNFLVVGTWTGKTSEKLGLRLLLPDATPGSLVARVEHTLQAGAVLYFYATSSYAALDRLIEHPGPRTHGLHTFYPVARLLQRAGIITRTLPAAIPPFVPVLEPAGAPPLSTNGYTFLFYPLEDFGPLGALSYAAVIGFGCGWIYGRAGSRRGAGAGLLVVGHLSTALALTFFVNKFNNTAAWYIFVWTLLPYVVARFARGSADAIMRHR